MSSLVDERKGNSSCHRGRLDIIADMLDASFTGVRKTYLMYRCNLSFKQLKRYMGFLLRREFIQIVPSKDADPRLFEITEKGRKFLRAYRGLMDLMG